MSKYILYLIFILCFQQKLVSCETLNVGTTLFSETDIYRQCWSSENIAILTTRMILEDLLPSVNTLTIDSDEFVNDIIQYFKLILEVVKQETYGKTKHITMIAYTDVLGGYFNSVVLPLAKFSYYSGFISYDSVKKLFQVFEELKWFLRTNGQGWAKPIPQDVNVVVDPLIVQYPTKNQHPCNCLNYESVQVGTCAYKRNVTIPLPFLDSNTKPGSIAVPFKTKPLRNIESKCASYLILKYYVTSFKCLLAEGASNQSIKNFQDQLYTWIYTEVLPILNDEKFYSGFGGIFRVVAGLTNNGAKVVELNTKPQQSSKDMFRSCPAKPMVGGGGGFEGRKKLWVILPIVLLLVLACIIVLCCIRSRRRNCICTKKSSTDPTEGTTTNTVSADSSAKNFRGATKSASSLGTTIDKEGSSYDTATTDTSSKHKKEKKKKTSSNAPLDSEVGYVTTDTSLHSDIAQRPRESPWPAPQMTPFCDCGIALTGTYAIDLNTTDPEGGFSYLSHYNELESSTVTSIAKDDKT